MKISQILRTESLTYRLLFKHFVLATFLLSLLFFGLSYFLSLLNFEYSGDFFQILSGFKVDSLRESDLEFTKHIESFIVMTNILLFIGPLLLIVPLSKQRFETVDVSPKERKKMYKVLVGVLFLASIIWIFLFLMPFKEGVLSNIVFFNKYSYMATSAFMFMSFLNYQFCIYSYLLILIKSKNGE